MSPKIILLILSYGYPDVFKLIYITSDFINTKNKIFIKKIAPPNK